MKRKNIAIVTGASGGLGLEFVKLLMKKSKLDEIWLIARSADKLAKIQRKCGNKIRIFPMDLSDLENIKAFGNSGALEGCTVRYLINNAGYAKFCSYGDLSIEESVNMIDLNISAVVAMGLVCIPHMARGSHIINIASQAAFQSLPYQNIYSSTKAFVRNYTRALNVELRGTGITATAVCPGWMKTGLYDRALIGAKQATKNFCGMVAPDVVAKKALRDAERGRDMSVYSPYVRLCHVVAKILPQRAMMRLWLLQQEMDIF